MMRSSLSFLNVGIVSKWIDTKGFGFIKDSNTQKEYFVHFRSLNMGDKGHRGLNVGQEVQFDPDDSDTRSQAVNVTSVGGGPLPPFDTEAAQNFSGGGGGGRGSYGGGRGGGNFNRGDNYNNNNNGGGNFRGGGGGRGRGGYNNNRNFNNNNYDNNNNSGFRGNSMQNGGDF